MSNRLNEARDPISKYRLEPQCVRCYKKYTYPLAFTYVYTLGHMQNICAHTYMHKLLLRLLGEMHILPYRL